MAGTGELFQGKDEAWRFRVKASNGQIVATGQGYANKDSAKSTLAKLMAGEYNGDIVDVDG